MGRITRDEVVRRLWLAGFDFSHETPTAHCFTRLSDRAEVLIPKRERLDDRWLASLKPPKDPNASPCCCAPSKLRLLYAGVVIFRCMSCLRLWERPARQRPKLRVVK